MKISIEKIKNELFEEAETRYKIILLFNIISFILTIVFAFLTLIKFNDLFQSLMIYTYFLLFIVLNILFFLWDKKYLKYRNIAEELRMIQFNKANLQIDITPEKKCYLIPRILTNATTSNNVDVSYDTDYFENHNLKFSLLQNIFFTQQNYIYHARFYSSIMWVLFITTIILIIILALSLNITTKGTTIFQIILSFINLITTAKYYLIYQSFKNKSDALKELDAELVKTNSENENKSLSLLIEYNSLIIDSYPTFTCIYKKHQNVLNIAWNERITSLDKAKFLTDFKENIEKDIKHLLLPLKNFIYKGYVIIGSYLDHSFVNGKSDLDILLVFENTNKIHPEEFYNKILNILKIRFGNNLIESPPAFIVKSFGDITIEFTPCVQIEGDRYKIVTSSFQLEEICPQKYSEYFQSCNNDSDGLFYSLARELIRCKYEEHFSISSIYLKIYLSEFIKIPESDKTLLGSLKDLARIQLKKLENPVEPQKPIAPCPDKEKNEVIRKIKKYIKKLENGKS